MGRKRKGDPVHGWLVLDKPAGMSSAKLVAIAKRIFNARKVGHTGTLDPLASGVLPLAFGEATKLSSFAMAGRKTYQFEVLWGTATSTEDAEGEVIETSAVRPDGDAIAAVLSQFTGIIEQIPPAFSAVHVDGERAYKRARAGEQVQMPSRQVEVYSLAMLRADPDRALFEVDCGPGTYVRALGRDLARALGTVGHIGLLRRTKSGKFGEKQAFSLDQLESFDHSPRPLKNLLPVQTVLDDIPALAITAAEAEQVRQGQSLSLAHQIRPNAIPAPADGDVVQLILEDQLIALAEIDAATLRPKRVFVYG